ncbi:DUF1758 domain-containing protein [Nephila pilipes]|uniref:DUF1758 domain-containing protein n=1 Tax=Nephila pilipes TaxID=299642 RepID=A0A8X6T3Q5_NEPPI|nr:DUF1758 domain-containing protein [Nephila pilipes]
MWDLDSFSIFDPIERKPSKFWEEEALTHLRKSIKVNKDQRYDVALPWLVGYLPLYDDYDKAELRLRSITKRLNKENAFDSYDNVFHQWQKDGIIEIVTGNELSELSHYLSHHPLIKLLSATTKIRLVFNASSKQPGYASLNECLSVGPNLIQQIPSLLNRFRSFGVTADIKQAFL